MKKIFKVLVIVAVASAGLALLFYAGVHITAWL